MHSQRIYVYTINCDLTIYIYILNRVAPRLRSHHKFNSQLVSPRRRRNQVLKLLCTQFMLPAKVYTTATTKSRYTKWCVAKSYKLLILVSRFAFMLLFLILKTRCYRAKKISRTLLCTRVPHRKYLTK